MAVGSSSTHSTKIVFQSGWLCLLAGVVGVAAALVLIMVNPAVDDDRYSYPLTPDGFTTVQAFFAIHHLGLLAGLYGLWRSGAVGPSKLGRWGMWGAITGMALLAMTELVAISGANSAYPSSRTDVIDGLYGLSSMLIGLALTMTGIAVVRTGQWRGWQRYIPLILGVYVFVPLTPALFGSFELGRLAIGGWMLAFAMLGWALVETGRDPALNPSQAH